MKTITIYELIKLIKEDKAPKKVKRHGISYVYDDDCQDYQDTNCNYLIFDICNERGCWLNKPVEIIEEDKKIEKLEDYFRGEKWTTDIGQDRLDINFDTFAKKINELIDIVNDLKKEGKSE